MDLLCRPQSWVCMSERVCVLVCIGVLLCVFLCVFVVYQLKIYLLCWLQSCCVWERECVCVVRMSHVSSMDESCLTHEQIMPHAWMCHVACTNESCYIHERVTSHAWLRHVTSTNKIFTIQYFVWGVGSACKRAFERVWLLRPTPPLKMLVHELEVADKLEGWGGAGRGEGGKIGM